MRKIAEPRLLIAVLIMVVWAIAYLVAIASSNYTGVIAATPAALIAASFLLGTGILGKAIQQEEKSEEPVGPSVSSSGGDSNGGHIDSEHRDDSGG